MRFSIVCLATLCLSIGFVKAYPLVRRDGLLDDGILGDDLLDDDLLDDNLLGDILD